MTVAYTTSRGLARCALELAARVNLAAQSPRSDGGTDICS